MDHRVSIDPSQFGCVHGQQLGVLVKLRGATCLMHLDLYSRHVANNQHHLSWSRPRLWQIVCPPTAKNWRIDLGDGSKGALAQILERKAPA